MEYIRDVYMYAHDTDVDDVSVSVFAISFDARNFRVHIFFLILELPPHFFRVKLAQNGFFILITANRMIYTRLKFIRKIGDCEINFVY